MENDPRLIAASRSLLFNYGQGMWTPHSTYRSLCSILSAKANLSSLPVFKDIPFAFSFFSKKFFVGFGCQHFFLYHRETEGVAFTSLPTASKLNWMRNFFWMQELLFSFSEEEIARIFSVLETWKRPVYEINRIPFQKREVA